MIVEAAFCLAMTIYYEARSEPLIGQQAVADVIMNRANWKRKYICTEVFRSYQITSLQEIKDIPKATDKEWQTAVKIANKVLHNGQSDDITYGANHFFLINTHPWWKTSCLRNRVIKHHNFCYENIVYEGRKYPKRVY